jgi:hypothetical protein
MAFVRPALLLITVSVCAVGTALLHAHLQSLETAGIRKDFDAITAAGAEAFAGGTADMFHGQILVIYTIVWQPFPCHRCEW